MVRSDRKESMKDFEWMVLMEMSAVHRRIPEDSLIPDLDWRDGSSVHVSSQRDASGIDRSGRQET